MQVFKSVPAAIWKGEGKKTKQTGKQKALYPTTVSFYTLSSCKTYCRLLFNGLLNTSMQFQLESNQQNTCEFN